MITYITTLTVPPENTDAFVAAMADMQALVRAHEPGVVHFQCSRASADATAYTVIEIYHDEAAFTAHWQTDYIRPILARTRELVLAGSLLTTRYEAI